jgi:hypothetical protein
MFFIFFLSVLNSCPRGIVDKSKYLIFLKGGGANMLNANDTIPTRNEFNVFNVVNLPRGMDVFGSVPDSSAPSVDPFMIDDFYDERGSVLRVFGSDPDSCSTRQFHFDSKC